MSTGGGSDTSQGIVQMLSNSRQGRLVTSHLASVSVKLANATFDSSMRQCASMRRVVLEALRTKSEDTGRHPFGLPVEIPRVIVVANLAGDYVMLYEEHGYSLLYQFLNIVTAPGARQGVRAGVDAMAAFASEKDNRGLLLVYSMPPLEDTNTMHWELRSVTSEGGRVRDGARHFARGALEPCCGTPTGETTEPAIMRAETAALQNHVMAVSVNVAADASSTADTATCADAANRETVLRNTVAALQAHRNRVVEEMNAMRNERIQNMEKEKIMARSEVDKEIEAARVAKKLANKSKADAGIELKAIGKELKATQEQLRESKTVVARMELTHAQEKEALQRHRALYEREKKDLKLAKERAEKQASEALRATKAELDNLRFDSQARNRLLESEAAEFKRKERMNREMHDRVVACMAGQDAELDVLKARLAECEAEVGHRDATIATLRAEAVASAAALGAAETDLASAEAEAKAAKAANQASELREAQLEKKAALLVEEAQQQQRTSATAMTTCSREAQTTMTTTTTTTIGTDTYIDTAQRSKATQTEMPADDHPEAFNVADATKRVFVAFEQLCSIIGAPPSEYVAQSGVHPPARRFRIVNKQQQLARSQ